MAAMPDMEAIENLSLEDPEAVADEVTNVAAAVMMGKPVADDMMADEWRAIAQGEFVGADNFHQDVVIYCAPFHVVFATATVGS